MSTAMYAVEGMICESCLAAVLENVHSLSGVTVAAMDLVTGGQSPLIVTSGSKLGAGAVRGAVEDVGFGVWPPRAVELLGRVTSAAPAKAEPIQSVSEIHSVNQPSVQGGVAS